MVTLAREVSDDVFLELVTRDLDRLRLLVFQRTPLVRIFLARGGCSRGSFITRLGLAGVRFGGGFLRLHLVRIVFHYEDHALAVGRPCEVVNVTPEFRGLRRFTATARHGQQPDLRLVAFIGARGEEGELASVGAPPRGAFAIVTESELAFLLAIPTGE